MAHTALLFCFLPFAQLPTRPKLNSCNLLSPQPEINEAYARREHLPRAATVFIYCLYY